MLFLAIILGILGVLLGFFIGRHTLISKLTKLEKQVSTYETENKNLDQIKEIREKFSLQFENLANKIFKSHATQFKTESESKIKDILFPLKEKLNEFQKKVEDTYSNEARERFSLQNEIKKITLANEQITQEAKNLTLALKGDVKAQGSWGEIVLERILESSGLRAGEEYIVQAKSLGLADNEGKRLKPDIIINLPDKKHIIIDSKVSLTNYEQFISEQNKDLKTSYLKNLLNSIYAHIDGLNAKKYEHLDKIITPDFVLMFMPIEGAFSLAIQNDNKLFSYAWDKNIVIVSPTTLLATLRTIASIWKQENQNKNAMEIAKRGGLLYDKFVSLIADLENIETNFKKTSDLFIEAKNKIRFGKGNLISQVEKIKTLGAKTSKQIPETMASTGLAIENDSDPLETLNS